MPKSVIKIYNLLTKCFHKKKKHMIQLDEYDDDI